MGVTKLQDFVICVSILTKLTLHTCVRIHIHTHTYVYAVKHTRARTHTHTYVYADKHIHTHSGNYASWKHWDCRNSTRRSPGNILFWHRSAVEQSGAVEACWAHIRPSSFSRAQGHPEVRGSKPRSANVLVQRIHVKYNKVLWWRYMNGLMINFDVFLSVFNYL